MKKVKVLPGITRNKEKLSPLGYLLNNARNSASIRPHSLHLIFPKKIKKDTFYS